MIDINKILNSTENENVEAKKALGGIPNSICETYYSFANTFGGVILLGVDEDKKTKKLTVTGVSNATQMIIDI